MLSKLLIIGHIYLYLLHLISDELIDPALINTSFILFASWNLWVTYFLIFSPIKLAFGAVLLVEIEFLIRFAAVSVDFLIFFLLNY